MGWCIIEYKSLALAHTSSPAEKTTVNQANINDRIIPAEWMLVTRLVSTGFNVPLNTL